MNRGVLWRRMLSWCWFWKLAFYKPNISLDIGSEWATCIQSHFLFTLYNCFEETINYKLWIGLFFTLFILLSRQNSLTLYRTYVLKRQIMPTCEPNNLNWIWVNKFILRYLRSYAELGFAFLVTSGLVVRKEEKKSGSWKNSTQISQIAQRKESW